MTRLILCAIYFAVGSSPLLCLLIFRGFERLNRCCMSARTVIAAVARVDQPMTFEQIVQHLIDDDHTEAIKEGGRVQ